MGGTESMERAGPVFGVNRTQRTGLVTILFTDMVGSTALKHELGDRAAAELFRKHHEVIRQTLKPFPQGEEIQGLSDWARDLSGQG